MLLAATPIDTGAHIGIPTQRLHSEPTMALAMPSPRRMDPTEHRLAEPIVVPLPRRTAFDSPDW